MASLTKTEQAIMAKAAKQPVVSAEMIGGRGCQGGKISVGVREYRAFGRLIRDGLLVLVNTQSDMMAQGNGYHSHHYIVRAKLAV